MILLANLHVLRLNRKGGSLVSVCEALRRNAVVEHCFNKLIADLGPAIIYMVGGGGEGWCK